MQIISVHRGGEGGSPSEPNLFYPSLSSAAEERKKKKNLEVKPPKIGGFRIFFAKMALYSAKISLFPAKMSEFTAIWRAFIILLFYPPLAILTVHMYDANTPSFSKRND